MRTICASLLALAACASAPAPAPSPPPPPPPAPTSDAVPFDADAREAELAFLRDALRASYAHLETKRTDFGVDIDAAFARHRDEIRAAATWTAYERAMVGFVSELHDGHIVWRRTRGPTEKRRRIVRLGLDTVLVGDDLIVANIWAGSAAEQAGLRAGDRIVAIDGATVAERMARLATLRSWSRLESARYDFAEEWPAARVEEGHEPRARVLSREARDGATAEMRVAPETAPRPGGKPAPVTVEARGAAVLLRMSTLSLSTADLAPSLADVRARLAAGARGVVVDLRGNVGGFDRAAAEVAAALSPRPLTAGERRIRLSAAVRAARPQWRDLAEDPARPGWSAPQPLTAAGGGVATRVAALVDAGCRSSCESLALLLRAGGARLYGATTGGASGGPITVTLPQSHATVKIPVWALYDTAGRPIEDHGVEPDEAVAPTRADVAAARDPVLERALAGL